MFFDEIIDQRVVVVGVVMWIFHDGDDFTI
jgi:hypothetical protein